MEEAEKPNTIPLIFAGPKGNTISKKEKENIYEACGHARKIKRDSGVSQSDVRNKRKN